jgi:predicted O-methyltransferase YrrM
MLIRQAPRSNPLIAARRRLALFTRVQALAARHGLHVARRRDWRLSRAGYYSPLPDLDRLEDADWDRVSAMHGVELDPAAQLAFAEAELAPFVAELDLPARPGADPLEFFLDNDHYESVDAEIAYAMLRRLRPQRVVELGSGFSTQVLARAAARNGAEGHPCELVACNPYPSERMQAVLDAGVPGLAAHHEIEAQRLPLETFTALGAGDVLFIDTSHVVKLGGEVVHLFLEVLPILAPGVVVHVHDIALPYEYDRRFVVDLDMPWAEQYLLQALLSGNDGWEIVFAAQAAARHDRERLARLVPSLRPHHYPSAFWMRRTAA